MTSAELENLVRLGQLKREPPMVSEVRGLLRSGDARLADADEPLAALLHQTNQPVHPNMPEIGWRWGYAFVWALIVGAVAGMIGFFRRKKWL